ncbi:MAG: NfeD family protein [Anaerolineae bacterium]
MRRVRLIGYISLIIAATFLWLWGGLGEGARAQGERWVYLLEAKGAVSPALLSYIERGINVSEEEGATCIIIQLDTPGGSVDLTKEITQKMRQAGVPIVVYVAPRGAHAASAGTFITMAGHAAAMAPGSSIGAASPVGPQGETITGTMGSKITNILVADIEGLTKRRGEKAVEWAKKAVTEAAAATSEEALELGVIDFIAEDVSELLEKLDGFTVKVRGEEVMLRTAGAEVVPLPMNPLENFLHVITNPNIAFILMTLGINGLIFELSSPGGYLAGIIGAVCLVLALYAFGVLPVNYTGLLFIVLAFILFLIDIKAPTHGILTAAGVASFVFGSLILFSSPYYQVSRSLIAGVALTSALFFAFVVAKAMRAQRWRVTTGREGMLGQVAVARTELNPEGTVFLLGERWSATSEDGPIKVGEKVEVISVEGLLLRVRRWKEER